MSVAVLLNDIETTDANGETISTPRSQDELDALRELVTMAAGINTQRGDTLTLQSLSFEPIVNNGVVAERDLIGEMLERYLMTFVQVIILAIVTLVLGLFVVKPLLVVAPTEASSGAIEQLSMATPAAAAAPAQPLDAFDALKSLASDKTDETAGLIQSWLDEPEQA